MHLAAAAGAPTIGLFGPSNEVLYGPWGRNTMVVRGPRSFEQIKAVDPQLNQPVCHMRDLRVDAVVEAARVLFDLTRPAAPPAEAAEIETVPAPQAEPAPRAPRKRAAKAKKETDGDG
jgi:hypothetical protein